MEIIRFFSILEAVARLAGIRMCPSVSSDPEQTLEGNTPLCSGSHHRAAQELTNRVLESLEVA